MPLQIIQEKNQVPILFDNLGQDLTHKNEMIRDIYNITRQAYQEFTNPPEGELAKGATIQTIDDVLNKLYTPVYPAGSDLAKVDAPVLTDTAGVLNTIFGAMVYSQFNLEANAFGLLEHRPYQGGIRVKSARATTVASGGVPDHGTIPETVKPTYTPVTITKKTIAHAINWSALLEVSAPYYDSIRVPEQFKMDMILEHIKCLNEQVLTNVTTLPGDSIESLDRAFSSYSEVTNCADVDAGDANIYGIDRDTALGWSDSQTLHNNNVDRVFHVGYLEDMIDAVKPAHYATFDPKDYYYLTGYDTGRRISQELDNQQRFIETTSQVFNLNGVASSEPGFSVVRKVASFDNIPIYETADMVADGISRVYLINKNHAWWGSLLPTVALDYGLLSRSDPSGLDVLGDETLILTMGEFIVDNFSVHSKGRDFV